MTSKARRNGRAEKNKLNQTKCTQLGKEWEERERGTVMEKRNNKQEWDQERCPEERTRLPCAGGLCCVSFPPTTYWYVWSSAAWESLGREN